MTAPEDTPEGNPKPQPTGLRAARKAQAAARRAEKANVVTPIKKASKAPATKPAVEKKPVERKPAAEKPVRDAEHPWYTRKSYTAVPGQKLYEATGESGQIAVRSCAQVMTHAVSWAEPGQPGERSAAIRQGTVFNFYPSEEAATKAADALRASHEGARFVVVKAREYRGQPGDQR